MTKDCDTQYKVSRNKAGLTQEQAAELLAEETGRPLAVRTLSSYENGHDKVPDDVVAAMSKVYGCPIIVWLHVVNNPHIGSFFPDIQFPQTYGDMALLFWNVADIATKLLPDIMGKETSDDTNKLMQIIEKYDQAGAMLRSAILYGRSLVDVKEGENA